MDDLMNLKLPKHTEEILEHAAKQGFTASCDSLTGSLLRVLVMNKPNGSILELGTGAGYSTSWILEGMDQGSRLVSVEFDAESAAVARDVLGHDERIEFIVEDGGKYIEDHLNDKFDIIFADTWPGKFYLVEETLNMINPHGIYIIDDLNPQSNWPEGHGDKVQELIEYLETKTEFHMAKLDWSTGIIIMTRR
ncbi:putative O-methyltransferase YrrM [Paenibacillus anaericanus]|uniref:O-methyltransferase n=1 Tax=Paenibacillus anaericanus TaxID=170367 RepID=UPI00277FEAC4|nr:class I SAM-dependent methyltransferase [Paenibacillus anaericanus]MDQ0088479.1 putative O-methyltransferase YrrM [Paenibacillus anaericanus]